VSTSSKYSPNKLKQVIENGTPHFVLKCYISASFEFHRKKSEYYLYWFNKNAGVDVDTMRYKNMSNKKMGKGEVRFFLSISNLYELNDFGDDGCVWHHKEIGFNKDQVLISQLSIDFNQES
jgi:hypothetical protein